MIFVTGDTHGGIDIDKLKFDNFPQEKYLTKNNFVIITGDFGYIWNNTIEEKNWLNWFENRNYTTLFIDGNHENFNLLNEYPINLWNGGKIHKINNSVFHLMRGQVFHIDNIKIFTFGGSKSLDIIYRKENISWWKDELPSYEEYEEGINNLDKVDWNIDYIISHTCSMNTLLKLNQNYNFNIKPTAINKYFNLLEEKLKFIHWYFGHFHIDQEITTTQTVLFNKIVQLEK